jgi:hypothetical protein
MGTQQSPDVEFTVLEHIDRIQVPKRVFEEPVNEYWALIWLKQGLDFLYNQVMPFDEWSNSGSTRTGS